MTQYEMFLAEMNRVKTTEVKRIKFTITVTSF